MLAWPLASMRPTGAAPRARLQDGRGTAREGRDGGRADLGGHQRHDQDQGGPEEVLAYHRRSRTAFPDLRHDTCGCTSPKGAIIAEFDLLGTPGRPSGVPPTGKIFRLPMAAVFFHPMGNLITCERIYFDSASMAAQLGIVFRVGT